MDTHKLAISDVDALDAIEQMFAYDDMYDEAPDDWNDDVITLDDLTRDLYDMLPEPMPEHGNVRHWGW